MDLFNNQKINELLDEIGRALDISENQYSVVERRYKAVANHLSKDDSLLRDFEPDIMPQGSFLLGTMVKPIMQDDELDVDLVCRLKGKKQHWAQYHLKQEVGNQIKRDDQYKKMLDEEGKRCWTLIYSEETKFHMDVLPSLIGKDHFMLLEKRFSELSVENLEGLSIRITDKTLNNYFGDPDTFNWLKSNPFGYSGWFNDRKRTANQNVLLLNESVEPLPKYQYQKAPLQRIVQILKRHRDIMFGGDDDKPISIIITTLVAWSYNHETDLSVALLNVLDKMKNNIKYIFSPEHQKNIAWIGNPVNDAENFAEKWTDNTQKEDNFYSWLEKAQTDFEILKTGDFTLIYRILKTILGTNVVNEGFKNAGIDSFINESYFPAAFNKSLLNQPHREQPHWPIKLTFNLEIHGNFKQGKKQMTITPSTLVPKHCDIYFTGTTNTPRPFDVFWQVVNTGSEAESKGGLRGNIFQSKTLGVGGLRQKENSEYTGSHWIQGYIIKNGNCVARSYEFLVNIE
jgi:hypothetical protein